MIIARLQYSKMAYAFDLGHNLRGRALYKSWHSTCFQWQLVFVQLAGKLAANALQCLKNLEEGIYLIWAIKFKRSLTAVPELKRSISPISLSTISTLNIEQMLFTRVNWYFCLPMVAFHMKTNKYWSWLLGGPPSYFLWCIWIGERHLLCKTKPYRIWNPHFGSRPSEWGTPNSPLSQREDNVKAKFC